MVVKKVKAMGKLGLASTRMKDICDALVLARILPLEEEQRWAVSVALFSSRGATLPKKPPVALPDAFTTRVGRCDERKAFAMRYGREK